MEDKKLNLKGQLGFLCMLPSLYIDQYWPDLNAS